MAEILIGEDDADVRKWLGIALETEGHAVRSAEDGEATLVAIRARRPDLLILDVMMPKLSGLDVCRTVREKDPTLPILMLTARNKERDIVAGLSAGADDYMTKPFSMGELFARIAALLRRVSCAAAVADSIPIGRHRVDVRGMAIVSPDGRRELLAARECELLQLLAANRGKVMTRDELLNRLWGATFYGNTRTLDQHIALVRRKLGEDAEVIETVRNVGYRMANEWQFGFKGLNDPQSKNHP